MVPRVLHIQIRPELGGIETFLRNVYRNIDRSKVQFDFVAGEDTASVGEELEQLGGRIYTVRYGRKYLAELIRLMKENRYQIVHLHKNSAANILPLVACKLAGVKVIVVHSHNTQPSTGRVTKLLHVVNRPLLRKFASAKFACSQMAAAWMFGTRAVEKNEVVLVKNGIELERFAFSEERRADKRRELGLAEDTFVIGNVGRMTPQKNQVFLVDILAEVLKLRPNTVLMICGNGSEKEKILARAEERGVSEHIRLPGERMDIDAILQAMDAFVMPSVYEGLAISAIEAQASGMPTFLSDQIPNEAMLLDTCRKIPLEESAALWAKHIVEDTGCRREDVSQKIRAAGYDSKATAELLQSYYLRQLSQLR